MSHDGSWRAACDIRINAPVFQFEHREEARSVTDPGVGSGALLGLDTEGFSQSSEQGVSGGQ